MNQFDFKQYYRRSLPHVQQPAATSFVTFRLDGSIPRSVMDEWLLEKKLLESEKLRGRATGSQPDSDVEEKQHESFDRVIRDQEEFARTVNYVLNNPVKARMVSRWRDWQWSYCAPSLVEAGLVS